MIIILEENRMEHMFRLVSDPPPPRVSICSFRNDLIDSIIGESLRIFNNRQISIDFLKDKFDTYGCKITWKMIYSIDDILIFFQLSKTYAKDFILNGVFGGTKLRR